MRRVWDRRSTGTAATSLAEREDPRHCDTPSVPIPTWVDSIHSWMPANTGSGRTRRASRPRFGEVVSRPCHHDYTNPSLTPGVRHGFVTQLAAGAHLPLLGSRSAIRDRRLFSPNPPEPGAGRIASEQYLAIGWSERPRYGGVVSRFGAWPCPYPIPAPWGQCVHVKELVVLGLFQDPSWIAQLQQAAPQDR